MNRQRVAERLRESEGCISHMYRCTGGKVTIGVGHALETKDDAAKLGWQAAGTPVKSSMVEFDYGRVAGAKLGMAAAKYSGLSTCRMSDDDITALLENDITSFEQKLRDALPKWDTYPDPAQEALFDMAFNLGIGGLKKFKKLLRSIDEGNWQSAAMECHRRGINQKRNDETAELFRSAAGAAHLPS